MADERWIIVNGWAKFQHRDAWRGRWPAWIRNYTELVHRDEYLDLALSSRGVLHGLWLLYGISGEVLSENKARAALTTGRAHDRRHWREHIEALEQAGFITLSASRPVPPDTRDSASLEENRREEKELKPASKPKPESQVLARLDNDADFGDDLPTDPDAARLMRELANRISGL